MSTDKRDRILSRDVVASQIPSGDKHTIHAGTTVFIHQVLGGSYTVQSDTGLYRLDGKDADAIGETVVDQSVKGATLADGSPPIPMRSGRSCARYSTQKSRSTSSTSASFTAWRSRNRPTPASRSTSP